ncbi:MAG: hypothetical protein ABI353_18045 [Isosphaeraceae bacterium]
MPHRLVSVAILVIWAIAAGSLFTRDVLPNLLVGTPPDLRTIALADDTRPTRWTLMVASNDPKADPRAVGKTVTRTEHQRDGWFHFSSEAWIDSGELLRGTPLESAQGEQIEVSGDYDIDPSGNLDHFRCWVRFQGSRRDLLSLSGKLTKTGLAVQSRGPLPWLNWTKEYPYKSRDMVQGTLSPMGRMPNLHVGQRWESRVVSPLTGQVQTGRVEVVGKASILWDNNPVTTLEVVTRVGPMSAKTWVRPRDGLVLRQEIPLPMIMLRLDRVPDDVAPTALNGRASR